MWWVTWDQRWNFVWIGINWCYTTLNKNTSTPLLFIFSVSQSTKTRTRKKKRKLVRKATDWTENGKLGCEWTREAFANGRLCDDMHASKAHLRSFGIHSRRQLVALEGGGEPVACTARGCSWRPSNPAAAGTALDTRLGVWRLDDLQHLRPQ